MIHINDVYNEITECLSPKGIIWTPRPQQEYFRNFDLDTVIIGSIFLKKSTVVICPTYDIAAETFKNILNKLSRVTNVRQRSSLLLLEALGNTMQVTCIESITTASFRGMSIDTAIFV